MYHHTEEPSQHHQLKTALSMTLGSYFSSDYPFCVCKYVCSQARSVTKGPRGPPSRSCSSLFTPRETQITQFVCDLRFTASPLVSWYSWNFGEDFRVSLSRDAGRLTALMAIKISGRMLMLEKPTGNGRRMKERVHHLDCSLTMGGHN